MGDSGGIFIGPHACGPEDDILQVNPEGFIAPMSREDLDDEEIRAMNHRCLLGMCRSPVEQAHG